MPYLKHEELVSYLFLSQVRGSRQLSELDFSRLIQDMGLENANRMKQEIVRYVQEGHNFYVVQALLAA